MNLYKYHRQEQTQLSVHDGINNDYNLPKRKFNIYWKYANPDGKDNKIANTILHIQGNKIANNLDKASNEEIAGYTENNPYEITDEIYNKVIANQAILEAETDAIYKEKLNEKKIKDEKIKAETERFQKLLIDGGQEYFDYVKTEWETIKPKPESDIDTNKYNKFESLLKNFTMRMKLRKKESNYYIISKRNIVNGQIQPCTPDDFAISKEDWFNIKQKIRIYSWDNNKGCHVNGSGTGSKLDLDTYECILVTYKDTIKAVEEEFSCLNAWSQIRNKFSIFADKFKNNTPVQVTIPDQSKKGLFSGGKKTKRKTKGLKKSKKMRGKKKK